LGDDACLLEDDSVSKASLDAADDYQCDPEASNQVDRLFDHMAKGVMDASQAQSDDSQSVQILDWAQSNEGGGHLGERNLGHFTPVLEPVVVRPDASDACIARVVKTEMLSQKQVVPDSTGPEKLEVVPGVHVCPPKVVKPGLSQVQRQRTMSCPPAGRSGLSGHWSLECLNEHDMGDAGVLFSSKGRTEPGDGVEGEHHKRAVRGHSKTKAGGFLRHSLFSLKRIARLPLQDRRKVMQVLQKNARRRKP
jgi:hypothetical protein